MTLPALPSFAIPSGASRCFHFRRPLLCLLLVVFGSVLRGDELIDSWARYRSGNYEGALEKARASREADPEEGTAWRIEAQVLLTLGRYEEADALLKEALVEVPFSIRLRLLKHEAGLRSGLIEQAAAELQEITAIANNAPRYARGRDFLAAMGEAALLLGVDPRLVLENFLKPAQQDEVAPSREAFVAAGKLALQKHDYAVASRTFQEGLKTFIDDADLWWGMAASFINGDRTKLLDYATQALVRNPHHLPTRLLLAEHRIDTEDYTSAEGEIAAILALNPRHAEALALRSVIAQLQNRADDAESLRIRALGSWPTNPAVDHLIGLKLSQKYRFTEGAAAQRRALAFAPGFSAARTQLAQDLLRLGHDAEGWALAKQAHQEDPYDVTAYNLTLLQDQLDQFTTLTSPHFRLRMSKKEAPVYGERALTLLEQAREQLTAKYGLQLDQVVTVEIYPDPKDFAVRTFGMPGRPGFLGVCFGPVFTVNSPATQRSNWESVLWHEFCHVITLTLTRNRMPRWLSEGLSVYEERQADPRWGQRMTPAARARILEGRMQPVSEMSGAFLQAKSQDDVLFAYFQSSLLVEFIIETHGFDAIKSLLAALREGTEINLALERHVAPLEQLQNGFVPFAEAKAKQLGGDYDLTPPGEGIAGIAARMNPRNLPSQLGDVQLLVKQEQWAEAKAKLVELTRRGGYVPGEGNAHALLAEVCAQTQDRDGERAAWTVIAEHESDSVAAVSRLVALAREAGDWDGVARWSDAWLAINPLASAPWRALLEAAEHRAAAAPGVAAGRALLHLDPPDSASLHYRIARQLYPQDHVGARRHVLLALAEAPRYRDAYALLAQLSESPAAPSAAPAASAASGPTLATP